MSNYTKTTNFAVKDALPSGDAAKVVRGTEIDTEFTNIQTSNNSKADAASPTFTGTATFTGAVTVIDGNLSILGSSDATKKLQFEVDTNTPTATTLMVTPGAFQILPAGIGPLPYSGNTAPTGWLECDGSAVSRTTYAALFTAIGTIHGVGDGATTFNLPDCRGRSVIGSGTGTIVEALTAAVSASNGVPVTANNTKWITGMPVTLSNVSGFGGTIANGAVFIVRISSTNVRFATTLALAQNATPDVTITGTGNVTITGALTARTNGEKGGEETHAMSITELLNHNHGSGTLGATSNAASAGPNNYYIAGSVTAGGNVAMNNMQPYLAVKFIIST